MLKGDRMTDQRSSTPGAEHNSSVPPLSASDAPPPLPAGLVLSAADFAELMRELDDLRRRHRGEISQEARIAQLEHLARFATVVAAGADASGAAGLGSVVTVADELGGTMEFELVGRRTPESKPREVSLASPVGKALTGVSIGDVARVGLPSGEIRVLSVLDVVTHSDAPAEAA